MWQDAPIYGWRWHVGDANRFNEGPRDSVDGADRDPAVDAVSPTQRSAVLRRPESASPKAVIRVPFGEVSVTFLSADQSSLIGVEWLGVSER